MKKAKKRQPQTGSAGPFEISIKKKTKTTKSHTKFYEYIYHSS